MSDLVEYESISKGRKPLWYGLLAVLACIGIGFFLFRGGSTAEGGVADYSVFEVQEGPLLISVNEAGTIKAKDQEIIKSEVEGQTTILFLIEEGKVAKEGDLLVELDGSQLQDGLVNQQIVVQNKEASFINARENFEVVKNQAQSDISKAELDVQFAVEDLEKFQEGDHPMSVKEAEAKITLAASDLKRAEEKLRGSERLLEKDFLTSMEFEADKQSAEKARLDMELSQASLELLQKFTYSRTMTELQSAVTETNRALERAKLKANADIVQSEANLKAAEAEFKQQQDKLKKVETQILKTKIYAPTGGLVVYATTGGGDRGGRGGNQEPLDEGQTVRERQELIYLPTTASMMAQMKVSESNLSKVSVGMPVRVLVDSLPGRTFTGKITRIAPLPDAQSAWLNPDLKVYNSEVAIDGEAEGVRTGMGCRVEVLVERYDSAAYVPVQAVMLVKGKPTVYVVENGVPQPREVKIGLDNNRMVHVIDGLKAGEKVLLTPPLSDAAIHEDSGEGEGEGLSQVMPASDDNPTEGSAGKTAPAAAPAAISPDGPVAAPGGEGPGGGEARRGNRDGGEGGPGEAGPGGEGAEGRRGNRGEGGGRMGNMTPEQREEMRKRFENMSEEEREKMRQEFRQRREQGGGGGGAPGGDGAQGGGGGPGGGGGAPGGEPPAGDAAPASPAS